MFVAVPVSGPLSFLDCGFVAVRQTDKEPQRRLQDSIDSARQVYDIIRFLVAMLRVLSLDLANPSTATYGLASEC